ncbi:hypothetical protein [Streptomyces sp. NBC_01296]|uniref:hypothetical protein n=1 Tax=Streptomyces sp. NBC_01296 TaxID=2903816 RepID=UPI002E1467B8|nr:hypothetical protein OG299_39670 [Streptomyces sp. NBC_01296]
MSYHRPSPTATQSKRRISRSMMVFASAAFITGGIALPATAAIAPQTQTSVTSLPSDGSNPHRQPGGGAYGPDTCMPGYVWRDSFDGDTLCVTPTARQRVHDQNPHRQPGGGAYGPSTCMPGYVWREKFKGDTLCVTPAERQQAKNHGTVIDYGTRLIPVDE